MLEQLIQFLAVLVIFPPYFLLEMKEARKRQRDSSNTITGFIVQEGALCRGIPARELEPTAIYRLGVDNRAVIWRGLHSGKIPPKWSQASLGEVLGPWHSCGGQKVPRLTQKPACKTPLIDSLLAKLQELPTSQLTMLVNPFYLVITDKWRRVAWLFSERNTLHPLWCGPSYKVHYPCQPSCCTLNLRQSAL
jgi:hypothetical protein